MDGRYIRFAEDSFQKWAKWHNGLSLGKKSGHFPLALLVVILFIFLGNPPVSSELISPAMNTQMDIYSIGNHRQLFLDDWLVGKMDYVTRRLGTVTKHPDNPVLRREKPWESARCELYGSAVWDGQNNRLQMFYSAMSVPYDAKLAYAESPDAGTTWVKPGLDIHRIQGKPTNIVWPGRNYVAGPSVFIDTHDPNPNRRYKLFTCDYNAGTERFPAVEGIYVAWSPDGIHWTGSPRNPVVPGLISDTAQCAFWDRDAKKYVAFVRLRVEGRRSVGMMESRNFENWTEPVVVYSPTQEDVARDWQFYSLSVTPYEGLYVGLLWIFPATQASGNMNANSPVTWPELVVSRGGKEWRRVAYGEPFPPVGPAGQFDHRQIRTASSLVVLSDRLLLFYSASPDAHVREHHFDIGMATLRRDGFACIEAGAAEGTLLTKPFRHTGGKLMINATAGPEGYVKAELFDKTGRPIKSYEANHCREFKGDSLKGQITWKGKNTVPSTQEGVRIKFLLKNVKLYSFWIDPQ